MRVKFSVLSYKIEYQILARRIFSDFFQSYHKLHYSQAEFIVSDTQFKRTEESLANNVPIWFSLKYLLKHTGWNLTSQSTEWWMNGGWMATEWWRERWISVAFPPPFTDHLVDWMAGTFQWPFSQLFFWKIKLRPTRLELVMAKYANHSATGTVRNGSEYLVFV